jgi:hypothetical protein
VPYFPIGPPMLGSWGPPPMMYPPCPPWEGWHGPWAAPPIHFHSGWSGPARGFDHGVLEGPARGLANRNI